MVIVQSLRVGIIAKLTLFVLVIFGGMSFGLYGNRVYAACPDGYDYQGPSVDGDSDICTPSCDAQCQYEKKLGVRNGQGGLTDFGKCKSKGYSDNYCKCKESKGIFLNTEVPFIGPKDNPRCLIMSTASAAPVNVLKALTKILMTFVMIGGFGMIVFGGVQIAGGDVAGGKSKIIGVAIAFALLGSLGVILRFINPNFFS